MTALRQAETEPNEGSRGDEFSIHVVQHGPCWCRMGAAGTGSFDFIRSRTAELIPGAFDRSLLIVSRRLIAGAERSVRSLYESVPEPTLVISGGPCPATTEFWDELPGGWIPADDLIPVDIDVGECLSGRPEALVAALLNWSAAGRDASRDATVEAVSR